MSRTAYVSENGISYLENITKCLQGSIGLVLGQISSNRDDVINIVHLARTPEDRNETTPVYEEFSDTDKQTTLDLKKISESWIADHAKHVTRMLPGGMFVLGIFVVSSKDIFNDSVIASKLKSILLYINKTLLSNKYMHGVSSNCSDRLVIHMSSETKNVSVKSIEITESSSFKTVKLISNLEALNWLQFECYYEFDELYPVVVKNTGISVKEQIQEILEAAYKSIDSSILFLDGMLKDPSETFESQFKKKKNKPPHKHSDDDENQTVQVGIMVPCESKMPFTVEYLECEGTTHFSGIVASKVFLTSKATVEQAVTAVKQDIMRSLAARFTMHCDALIDDNLLPEEKVCFNEPPRRVYIRLPGIGGKVLLCDYLFPGESPVEALVSVKEMLDADITEEDVISNVETPADTSEFDALEKDPSSEEMLTTPQDVNKLYPVGVGVSVIVLIIAVIIYYYITISNGVSS